MVWQRVLMSLVYERLRSCTIFWAPVIREYVKTLSGTLVQRVIEVVSQRDTTLFLEMSQNSRESNFARVSFLIKLQGKSLQLYLKRDRGTGVFLWILRNFWEHLFLQNISGGSFCIEDYCSYHMYTPVVNFHSARHPWNTSRKNRLCLPCFLCSFRRFQKSFLPFKVWELSVSEILKKVFVLVFLKFSLVKRSPSS